MSRRERETKTKKDFFKDLLRRVHRFLSVGSHIPLASRCSHTHTHVQSQGCHLGLKSDLEDLEWMTCILIHTLLLDEPREEWQP